MIQQLLIDLIEGMYRLLWGDLFTLHFGTFKMGLSLLVLLLIPTGIFFTCLTRFLPIRLFKPMVKAIVKQSPRESLSPLQTLIVSTATRVGMGNLVGVVAAISIGGAGSIFWMWLTALLGASTAFIEGTLAQMHKRQDPIHGGTMGGPSYYMQDLYNQKHRTPRKSLLGILFATSALICWLGISQVVANSVSSSLKASYQIPLPITSSILMIIAACIVLRKKASVKVLDIMVPIMAIAYFGLTMLLILLHIQEIPGLLYRIVSQAFGVNQAIGGGIGTIILHGVKRGLFSNEAGSGSAPCAAAAADSDNPVELGFVQALGVCIDTIVICSCTAFIVLLVPDSILSGATGMDVLMKAMQYHLGAIGIPFMSFTLTLFCFSTFLGILFYAQSNIFYLFGNHRQSEILYKLLALAMLYIGGVSRFEVVWNLGDVGVGLMTIFNIMALYQLFPEVIHALKAYEKDHL